jgi:hypothetical protein
LNTWCIRAPIYLAEQSSKGTMQVIVASPTVLVKTRKQGLVSNHPVPSVRIVSLDFSNHLLMFYYLIELLTI